MHSFKSFLLIEWLVTNAVCNFGFMLSQNLDKKAHTNKELIHPQVPTRVVLKRIFTS